MAVADVDAVPGTGSARRRLLRIGVRLALTAGLAAVGWLLCGLAASAASASELPQATSHITSTPDPGNSGGGLLGGLLGNTVGSLGDTVTTTVNSVLDTVHTTLNTTLGTVTTTVNSAVSSVDTGVVAPAVTTVSKTVAPIVTPLVSTQPATAHPGTTQTPAATNPLPAQPSPAPAAAPVVKPTHHGTPESVRTNATRPVEQLRPVSPPVPLPKTPQPAPQQPLAPAPTVSTGHGPNGGNRHAVAAVISTAGGAALAQLTTVASHPIIIPGEMPGLPSVSPD
jgi:hypothetical protein